MSTMYCLMMDSLETGSLKRKRIARRLLEDWQVRLLNRAFKAAKLTDRYVRERIR